MKKLCIIFQLKHLSFLDSFKGEGVVREARSAAVSDIDVLRMIIAKMKDLKIPDRFYTDAGRFSSAQIQEEIASTGKWRSSLKTENLAFRFGHVSVMEHSFLIIEELVNDAAISWDDWVLPFLKFGEFTQAWISDVGYDFWQNATDPLQYKAAGRDYSHLKTVSNNLPPPLEQKIIDISQNPGRWILRRGYVEAIGATMWLGDAFWNRIGEDRKSWVVKSKIIDTTLLETGIMRLQARIGCFTNEDTKKVQEELRFVLYGRN